MDKLDGRDGCFVALPCPPDKTRVTRLDPSESNFSALAFLRSDLVSDEGDSLLTPAEQEAELSDGQCERCMRIDS